MRYLTSIIFTLILGSSLFGGEVAELKKSLNKWESVRKKANGNYTYKVRFQSLFGFGHETQIVVRDNKVSERRYFTWKKPSEAKKLGSQTKFTWVEKSQALGKHKEGANAFTMDELYKQAGATLERKRNKNEKLYVEFDKLGLLKSCFTVDTRIADDAPTNGVNIHTLTLEAHKAPNGNYFPFHWGAPPQLQTRDLRPLPGGYGKGSGTLAKWIATKMAEDAGKE